MPTITLCTEADILAAAGAFLGFAPTNSFVAYMLNRDNTTDNMHVRSAIRFDITITAEQAAKFPATCNLRPETTHAAVLLAVCDEHYEGHALTVLDALRDALAGAGIPVLRRVMTRDVTTEGQWYDPDTGATGPTYPYTDSLVTAHRVLGGDRISPARADIEAEFAPLPPAPPVALGDHGQLVIAVAEEIADALDGHPISRTLPTRAGIAITGDVALRDAMIAAAADHSEPGAQLWTHIARRLRGQPRAEALTVAAACYCLSDDSIRAGIAAHAALEEAQATETPPPRLALMLLTALRSGLPPQQIRRALIDATTRD